jgi:hypothetical protein
MMIYNMLMHAGWVREGPPKGIPIGAMQSVFVNVSDAANDHTKHAAGAFVDALNRGGIVAELDNETANPAIVDIVIGLKP